MAGALLITSLVVLLLAVAGVIGWRLLQRRRADLAAAVVGAAPELLRTETDRARRFSQTAT